MRLGETIENAIRKLVDYCHRKDVRCKNCPFVSKDNKCDLNMAILEDLVHFIDTEIIPTKKDVENFKKAYENVVALEISADIDTPSRYQTSDGKWHTGRIREGKQP